MVKCNCDSVCVNRRRSVCIVRDAIAEVDFQREQRAGVKVGDSRTRCYE